MHEVLVNHLGGLSLPRKSVVRLTDRPDMTLDVYHGRKTTNQQQHFYLEHCSSWTLTRWKWVAFPVLERKSVDNVSKTLSPRRALPSSLLKCSPL